MCRESGVERKCVGGWDKADHKLSGYQAARAKVVFPNRGAVASRSSGVASGKVPPGGAASNLDGARSFGSRKNEQLG